MIDGVGIHGFDDGEVVHHARRVGQQFAHPSPGLSMLPKRPVGWCYWEMRLTGSHASQLLVAANGIGHVHVELRSEARLVIQEIHLRRATRHKEIDGTFCLRRKMRQTEVVSFIDQGCLDIRPGSKASNARFTKESCQRGPSQHLARATEEAPARLDRSPLPLHRRRDGKLQWSYRIF